MPINFPYFPSRGQIYTYNGENWIYSGNSWVKEIPNVNWSTSLGSGEGVFELKTGTTIEFKSLVAGSGISISSNTNNEIVITYTGP